METLVKLFDYASLYGGGYFDITVGKPFATPQVIGRTRSLVFHDIDAIIGSKEYDAPQCSKYLQANPTVGQWMDDVEPRHLAGAHAINLDIDQCAPLLRDSQA